MNLKPFKTISAVLAIIGIVAFIYFQSTMKPEEFGGFKEGTEQYNGYRYAQDNQLNSVDQCDDEKHDPAINFNPDFLYGCKHYFK